MKSNDYPKKHVLPEALELTGIKFAKGMELRTVFVTMNRWRNNLLRLEFEQKRKATSQEPLSKCVIAREEAFVAAAIKSLKCRPEDLVLFRQPTEDGGIKMWFEKR